MKLKCIALSVTEVAAGAGGKVPLYNATLRDHTNEAAPTFRVTGGAGTLASTLAYGAVYELVEVA